MANPLAKRMLQNLAQKASLDNQPSESARMAADVITELRLDTKEENLLTGLIHHGKNTVSAEQSEKPVGMTVDNRQKQEMISLSELADRLRK